MLKTCCSTLSELWRTRRRWSLSLSRGSLTRRTNERLYSRRLADLWSAEVDKLVCSRARYKSPRESACILQSRPWPDKKDKQISAILYIELSWGMRFLVFYIHLNRLHNSTISAFLALFSDITKQNHLSSESLSTPPYETVCNLFQPTRSHKLIVCCLPSMKWQQAEATVTSHWQRDTKIQRVHREVSGLSSVTRTVLLKRNAVCFLTWAPRL